MEVLLARTVDQVDAWVARARKGPFVAVDTETTGWDPWTSHIRVLQLAAGPDQPVLVVDTTRLPVAVLGGMLADGRILKVFHNAAFDLRMLWTAGLQVTRVADTMLAQQIIDSASPEPVGASLAAIAQARLNTTLDKSVRTTFGQDGPLTAEQIDYAALDARVTWDIFAQQVHEMTAQGLVRTAQCEFDAVGPLAAMQLRGIGVDVPAWHRVLQVTEQALPDLAQQAQDALVTDTSPQTLFGPEPVNLDSPDQVIAALDRVGIHVTSTREGVLRDHQDHPAVAALSRYRQAAKIVSGWGGDWVERARHPRTGRVHASVRQIVGAGRMAHSDPNLTQVPNAPAYRGCFVAAQGHLLAVADYSQQELRILAAVSQDAALTQVFASGSDLHVQTAATVFGVAVPDVTAPQRKAAKAMNFGLMYGMGAPGFARATGMSVQDARAAMDAYFAGFPDVARWLRWTESQARRTNIVRTPLGRARFMTDAGTFARNAPIQGAGADMTKLAVANVDRAFSDRFGGAAGDPLGLVLTIHDELVVEAPEDDIDEAADILRDCMIRAAAIVLGEVPAEVDVKVGRSWAG